MREEGRGSSCPVSACVCCSKVAVLPNSTGDRNASFSPFAFGSRVGKGMRGTEGGASDAGAAGWSRAGGVEVRQGSLGGREAESA